MSGEKDIELAKQKAAAAAKAKAAALAKKEASAETTEEATDDLAKQKAAAIAKAKAAAAAKAKAAALAKKEASAETTEEATDDLAKQKAAAVAKAKAAAAAKVKAAVLAKKEASTETTEEATDDLAKQKAAAVAKAKAAAAAKAKMASASTSTLSGDVDSEKAKAIAAAKAKAAAAKAAASGKAGEKERVEEKKPSVNQPYLDKYIKVIEEHLGKDVLEDSYINNLSKDVPTIIVKKEAYLKVAEFLRYNEQLSFDYLSETHGSDFETHMEVYVHLYSYKNQQSVAFKVKLDRDEPVIDSLVSLWAGANWPECETYDLLGIKFTGHPDLYRIMLGDDWIGYPLRKDYEPYDVEV